jgi:hypothetical protein
MDFGWLVGFGLFCLTGLVVRHCKRAEKRGEESKKRKSRNFWGDADGFSSGFVTFPPAGLAFPPECIPQSSLSSTLLFTSIHPCFLSRFFKSSLFIYHQFGHIPPPPMANVLIAVGPKNNRVIVGCRCRSEYFHSSNLQKRDFSI